MPDNIERKGLKIQTKPYWLSVILSSSHSRVKNTMYDCSFMANDFNIKLTNTWSKHCPFSERSLMKMFRGLSDCPRQNFELLISKRTKINKTKSSLNNPIHCKKRSHNNWKTFSTSQIAVISMLQNLIKINCYQSLYLVSHSVISPC